MSNQERIEALRTRHAALDQELDDENHRPYPDFEHVNRIKREKLKLKDEMVRLSHMGVGAG